MNIYKTSLEGNASEILSVLGNLFRIRLVFALSQQEACVCHLEALLKKRQAYISQHLMALRKAGLLEKRRDGKFVYYRLSNPRIINLIMDAAIISGTSLEKFPEVYEQKTIEKCFCPHCEDNVSERNKTGSTLDLEIAA